MPLFSRNEVRTIFVRHVKSLDDAEMKFEVDASEQKNIALFVNEPPNRSPKTGHGRTHLSIGNFLQLQTRELNKLHKSPHRSEEHEDT